MQILRTSAQFIMRSKITSPGFVQPWAASLGLMFLVSIIVEAQTGILKLEPYSLETRDKQPVAAELGKLNVPENRRRSSSRQIGLAFVRLKSTAQNPGVPIIYLEGGPGNSGIAAAKGPAFGLLLALRAAGDVILMDQRGTGMSTPLPICRRTWDLPLDQPANPTEMLRVAKERLQACVTEVQQQGFDLAGYNTEESADDIEAVRQALGAKQVRLWGISYGTHLALTMMRRHERSVERAVLTGVSGPDHALLKLPSATQRQLAQVSALMKANADVSQRIPDFTALMNRLLAQLEQKPVTVTVTNSRTQEKSAVTVGKWDLQFFASSALSQTWGIAAAPAFYAALAQGDFTPLAQAALSFRRSPVGSIMAAAMVCASGASAERVKTINREAAQANLGNAINFPFPEACAALPSLDLGKAFRAPMKSTVPVLFISGTLDGRTPLANVASIQKDFSQSQHIIVEGASHGYDLFYFFPHCQEILKEFLQGRRVSTESISILPFKFDSVSVTTGKQ